ncbi:coiled-coil domain-containing protein 18 isoform X2 [Trichomycterus rosablanca]|uniref:coiled-coil domain-containing protein 18 isoform X2 n=1 Tax=Trichomycterus rosablanca TaxID=2290929 RepID=UPI002F35243F
MSTADRLLVDDVVSLRNQLRITERNLQALGEQLSQSESEIVAEHKDGSGSDGFPSHLTLEDLQRPDAARSRSHPGSVERTSTPKPRENPRRTCSRAHSADYRPRSAEDMENEAAQLRRKLASVRQENSSLVLENRQLVSDLEAAQLELPGSRSKLCVLGSSIGAKTSSVSLMKEQILDLEAQLEVQVKALRDAELRRAASEQTVGHSNRLVEELREELDEVKSDLTDRTRQWKRMEQQRNQALLNAEKLTAAFKDYKADVAEKLKKVMENEGKLKSSLIECDRQREELEKRCSELERERERTTDRLRELKEAREHSQSLSVERLELQGRIQRAAEELGQLQRELERKETQLQENAELRREREDLRLLGACQEQRLAQAHREIEQSRAELASLESLLDRLHLRENRDGALCINPCLLPPPAFSAATEHLQLNPAERYQKLLAALQSVEKEKARQASAAQNLQERLTRAQDEISSLQTTITQRASHYQQLHNQLLDKATQATTLEKELKKKNSRLAVLEKQLQEKSAAYSQAAIKTSQLEQQLLEKDSSIHHYQSVMKKKQKEHQETMETFMMAETDRSRELEDRMELLQLSLDQSRAEVAELMQTVSSLHSEKQESQRQACLLQASVAQLTQEMDMRAKHGEGAMQGLKEQASESAREVKHLETELSCCKGELNGCLQRIETTKRQHEKQLELKNSELSVLQEAVRSRTSDCERCSEENLQLQRAIQRQHSMLQESSTHIAQIEDNQSHLQNQVSRLERELEKERASSLQQLRKKDKEVEETKEEVQNKEKHAAELSASIRTLSSEMSACREELSEMEKELLRLRRDSNAKATQLCQMEETLQETKGLLEKKSEMVLDLEEKLHRTEVDRRNSLQRAHLMEEQLNTVRGELADTRGHLEELRDVLQRTQLTADQRQATIHQLTVELRESQRELEERNHEVLDMDTALKERQGELQQRAQLLGQLDTAIKEHKLEMEKKVEHLQEVLQKTERKLKEREEKVAFLTERLDLVRSQLQGKEVLEQSALDYGQQLRACREQLQTSIQELQDARARSEALSQQLDTVTQLERQKDVEVQQLMEQLGVLQKRWSQAESQLQTTVPALQQELEEQREEHHRELSALQQTRGQLLKVSDQISTSLRDTQEQLEEARADANDLRAQLRSVQQLLQHANEGLLIKESEITRLQAKVSSLERERASERRSASLHRDSGTFPDLSPPLKDSLPLAGSTSWTEASSDTSLELPESLKASVRAALKPPSSPCSGWQGLSHPDQSCTSEMTFNPLTYMLDGEEPQEPELDSLSGMLRFVNQTLALQEQHSHTE